MKNSVTMYLETLNPRRFETNTQRALFKLLKSGDWVRLNDFRIPSAGARIRDLRKERYGGFEVKCRSAASLERNGSRHTFYYKLSQRNLTTAKVRRVFELV